MGNRIDVYRWSIHRKDGVSFIRGIRRGTHTVFEQRIFAFWPAQSTVRGLVRYEAKTDLNRKVYLLGDPIVLGAQYDNGELNVETRG